MNKDFLIPADISAREWGDHDDRESDYFSGNDRSNHILTPSLSQTRRYVPVRTKDVPLHKDTFRESLDALPEGAQLACVRNSVFSVYAGDPKVFAVDTDPREYAKQFLTSDRHLFQYGGRSYCVTKPRKGILKRVNTVADTVLDVVSDKLERALTLTESPIDRAVDAVGRFPWMGSQASNVLRRLMNLPSQRVRDTSRELRLLPETKKSVYFSTIFGLIIPEKISSGIDLVWRLPLIPATIQRSLSPGIDLVEQMPLCERRRSYEIEEEKKHPRHDRNIFISTLDKEVKRRATLLLARKIGIGGDEDHIPFFRWGVAVDCGIREIRRQLMVLFLIEKHYDIMCHTFPSLISLDDELKRRGITS